MTTLRDLVLIMNNNFYVYIYFDPSRDMEPFYVGKGKGKRSDYHLTRKDKHPMTYRIQKMKRFCITPIVEKYEGLTDEAALSLEKDIIKQLGRKDLELGPLLNMTDGGEGECGHICSDETKAKLSVANKGRVMSNEVKEKISKARKGKILSDETKTKISIAKKGRVVSDEARANMSAAQKGKKHTPEACANMSKGRTGIPLSESHRKNISLGQMGKYISPEACANISNALKNQKKVKCLYCDKVGIAPNMKRWHNENCKFKP